MITAPIATAHTVAIANTVRTKLMPPVAWKPSSSESWYMAVLLWLSRERPRGPRAEWWRTVTSDCRSSSGFTPLAALELSGSSVAYRARIHRDRMAGMSQFGSRLSGTSSAAPMPVDRLRDAQPCRRSTHHACQHRDTVMHSGQRVRTDEQSTDAGADFRENRGSGYNDSGVSGRQPAGRQRCSAPTRTTLPPCCPGGCPLPR